MWLKKLYIYNYLILLNRVLLLTLKYLPGYAGFGFKREISLSLENESFPMFEDTSTPETEIAMIDLKVYISYCDFIYIK
jgi:hypothetical protein